MKRRVFMTAPAVATLAPSLDTPPAFEGPSVVEGNLPVFAPALRDELDFPLAWRGQHGGFGVWRQRARSKVLESLLQPADRTPFQVEVIDTQPGPSFDRRQIVFNVTRHSRVRALLLVPHGPGPFPAALLLHDHGAKYDIGKEKLISPWYDPARLESATAWSTRYFGGRFLGDSLAARGYVVLAVDALGWGDRGGLTYEAQQALASNMLHLGSSLSGLMAHEDVRAAAMLAARPEVDRSRVAAVGFSMGGYRAWQVAALSDHIAATVSVCWMTGLREMMVPGNNTLRGQSAFYMMHPGLYRHLDIPDVASIAAPRPMMVLNGETDPLFTPAGTAAAHARMRTVWNSQHAGHRLHTRIWPGLGHTFTPEQQDAAFSWLDGWLSRR
ncbi:dienelactone hydrolase family protein [Actinoplanes sp. NPDC051861]|uniref:dienelactone hydrolase family protein n=1 Tax=Actinoplanes sp. NPDC051861 TaxID=3155170 RepID=UPI003416086D